MLLVFSIIARSPSCCLLGILVENEDDDESDSEVKGNRLHVKPCG